MRPEWVTVESELLGYIVFYGIPLFTIWVSSAIWAYVNDKKARKLVRAVEERKRRARGRVEERLLEEQSSTSHAA